MKSVSHPRERDTKLSTNDCDPGYRVPGYFVNVWERKLRWLLNPISPAAKKAARRVMAMWAKVDRKYRLCDRSVLAWLNR